MLSRLAFALVLCATAAGCALPAAAPTSSVILSSAAVRAPAAEQLPFAVIDLTLPVVEAIARVGSPKLRRTFGASANSRVSGSVLGPGDTVAISIYESGTITLFGGEAAASGQPGSGHITTLPAQIIESDGTIDVPVAGQMRIAGKTPGKAGQMIASALHDTTQTAQVIVTVVNNASNLATVGGEVNRPGPVAMFGGKDLLEVIAEAGGAKYPAYETDVKVIRGRTVGNVSLMTVVNHPSQNIAIAAGDAVYLSRNPDTFVVLGASQRPAEYPFEAERVSLAQAIARSGGAVDAWGNPAGIYLFRFEPTDLVEQLLGGPAPLPSVAGADFTPVAYHLNMGRGDGYFLSQGIDMRDGDVVLITNAEGAQLGKLLALVRGFTGTIHDLAPNARPN